MAAEDRHAPGSPHSRWPRVWRRQPLESGRSASARRVERDMHASRRPPPPDRTRRENGGPAPERGNSCPWRNAPGYMRAGRPRSDAPARRHAVRRIDHPIGSISKSRRPGAPGHAGLCPGKLHRVHFHSSARRRRRAPIPLAAPASAHGCRRCGAGESSAAVQCSFGSSVRAAPASSTAPARRLVPPRCCRVARAVCCSSDVATTSCRSGGAPRRLGAVAIEEFLARTHSRALSEARAYTGRRG